MRNSTQHKLYWLLMLSIYPCVDIIAQESVTKYHINDRADFSVPHIKSNKALKNSFRGTYDVTPSINIPLFYGVFIGGSYKYSTASDKLGLPTSSKAQYAISGGAIKLGYDHYINPTTLFTTAINYGMSSVHFKNLPSDTVPPSYKSSYIEPSLGFQFFIEDNFAIGVNLSYVMLNQYTFNPYRISFDPYKSFEANDLKGTTQYLNLGFGVVYAFWKKKSSK